MEHHKRTLTKRESAALSLLSAGLTAAEIAELQSCATSTAKKRIATIYFKLGVSNAKQAISAGFRQGIISGIAFYIMIITSFSPTTARTKPRIFKVTAIYAVMSKQAIQ